MPGIDAFLVSLALCSAGAFAVCGIPFGYLVGRLTAGVDVREHGSGNIGMTNVARTLGASAAALTLLLDAAKGALCMLASRAVLAAVAPAGLDLARTAPGFAALTLVLACCILGHVFSPYLGFHGGKGISVGFGAALGLYWPVGLVLLAAFLAVALPTRYVSAGSVTAAVVLPLQCLLVWHLTPWATLPLTVAAGVVVWAHRTNIVKLAHGEERRFTLAHTRTD